MARMSPHDKSSAMENWRDGVIEAMVCTSAFGMGINQSDVDIVVRVGCPPSIESWSQELGCTYGQVEECPMEPHEGVMPQAGQNFA